MENLHQISIKAKIKDNENKVLLDLYKHFKSSGGQFQVKVNASNMRSQFSNIKDAKSAAEGKIPFWFIYVNSKFKSFTIDLHM